MSDALRRFDKILTTADPTPHGKNISGYLHDDDIKKIRQALQSQAEKENTIPCVSCGKPSDTSTPDDADMCFECFGSFNANCVDEQRRVMKMMAEALEISIGYTSLVADGVGKMPILKDRAKSDTEMIGNALSEYTKVEGV